MPRATSITTFCLYAAILTAFLPSEPTWAVLQSPSKAEALIFVTSLKDQNTARLRDTDQAIDKKLNESHNSLQLASLENDIEKLRTDRRELLLRQDFIDRLSFQIDTKYKGNDISGFLRSALQSMAFVELRSNNEHTIWKFLNYVSLLIQNSPENKGQILALVEGYMKQTNIENPMRPDEYLAKMAYSNGSQTEAAHPMDRAKVGEYTDKRLKEIKASQVASNTAPAPTAPPPSAPTPPPPPAVQAPGPVLKAQP